MVRERSEWVITCNNDNNDNNKSNNNYYYNSSNNNNNKNDNGLLNGAHEMALHLSKLFILESYSSHEIKWIETASNCKIKSNK